MTVQDCISKALLICEVIVLNKILFYVVGVLRKQPHPSKRKSQTHDGLDWKRFELDRVGRCWFCCFAAFVGEELVLEAIKLFERLFVCYLHCDLIEVRLLYIWEK